MNCGLMNMLNASCESTGGKKVNSSFNSTAVLFCFKNDVRLKFKTQDNRLASPSYPSECNVIQCCHLLLRFQERAVLFIQSFLSCLRNEHDFKTAVLLI